METWSDPDPTGTNTENRVASLYRALGYEVTQNVMVAGNQIDVVARKSVPGTGDVKLMIDAKYRSGTSIPKSAVLEFRNVAGSVLGRDGFTKALMVGTVPFTKDGKTTVDDDPRIDLVTLDELVRWILDASEAMSRWVKSRAEEPINRRYVDLAVRLAERHHERPTPANAVTALTADQILDAAETNPAAVMVVLADYGAGKSTSVEHLKDVAANRYLSMPGQRIPVLFRLRELRDDLDMRTFIEHTCAREIGQPISDSLFREEAANGGFLILLDGFDEITLNANEQVRAELMQRLQPLLYSRSPAVLTSRPSYFLDANEYKAALAQRRAGVPADSEQRAGLRPSQFVEGLLDKLVPDEVGGSPFVNYDIYELQLLDSDQIDSYLESHRDEFNEVAAGEPAAVRAFLDSVYDLSDLVRRPFILRMVVETVLGGRINAQNETVTFGPAALYQAYAETTVLADFRKAPSRRLSLSTRQRLDFAEACARHMQQHGKEVLERDDLVPVLAAARIPTTTDNIESVLTDLRTCSFLSITDSGHLRFIHRSFQEFFMARHLKAAFDNQRLQSLDASLGWEILYFFGAFAVEDPEFHERLGQTIRSRSQQETRDANRSELALSNMATVYLYGKERVTGCDWRRLSVQHLQRSRTAIAKSNLDHVVFSSIEGIHASFEECDLNDVGVTVAVKTASFVDCRGSWSLHGSAETVELSRTDASVYLSANVRLVTQNGGSTRLSLTGGDETSVDLADAAAELLDARQVRINAVRSRLDLGPLTDGSHLEGVIERSRVVVPDHAGLSLRTSTFDGITIATVRQGRSNLDRNVETDRAHPIRTSTFDRGALIAHSAVNWDDSMPDHDGTLIVGGHVYHKLGDRKWRGFVFKELPPQARGNGFCRVAVVNSVMALVEGTGPAFHETRRRFDREVVGVKPDSGTHLAGELAKWLATIDGSDAALFVLDALKAADGLDA